MGTGSTGVVSRFFPYPGGNPGHPKGRHGHGEFALERLLSASESAHFANSEAFAASTLGKPGGAKRQNMLNGDTLLRISAISHGFIMVVSFD
jgi:hypothetical protein